MHNCVVPDLLVVANMKTYADILIG
jgi:hypothetical protein